MPFSASIEIIKKIVVFIDTKIKENEAYDKSIRKETNIYNINLKTINGELGLIIDRLRGFQELSPTTEEVGDLKLRCNNLFNNVKNCNDLLIAVHNNYKELIDSRTLFKKKWYNFFDCYGKSVFLESLIDLNKEINTKMGLVKNEYDNLVILMNVYEKQIYNLKFKFLPLRRLWISNKWDVDANQNSQRVTIATLIQEIQSKELSRELKSNHYENMQTFLTRMIEDNKSQRQIEAIGLGKSCGTYFLNSSLMASLTNLPCDKLHWNDLSDMVYYFSLLPIEKSTDDRITPAIIEKYNASSPLKELKNNIVNSMSILQALKNSNNNEGKIIDTVIDINIQKNLCDIMKNDKNRNYKAYIYKNGIKYLVSYRCNRSHTTVFYETEKEGKLGKIDLDIHDNNINHCIFIKREYEGNSYFYTPPILWYKGTGHEYSLHYDNINESWFLSRFNYSCATDNNCSSIFVDIGNNNYKLLKRRGSKDIIECDFTVIFE